MINNGTCEILRNGWKICHDPEDEGRRSGWYTYGLPDTAVPAVVPSLVHEYFPEGYGTAWYYKSFTPSFSREGGMNYVLRFGMAEFWCDVYLNGLYAGNHRGCEDPFEIDITGLIRFDSPNELYVRLSKPYDKPVNGYTLEQIPHRNQLQRHLAPGSSENVYGLREEVALMALPKVRIDDAFIYGDVEGGCVSIDAVVLNNTHGPRECVLTADCGSKRTGYVESSKKISIKAEIGENKVSLRVPLRDIQMWSPDDPFLYFVDLTLEAASRKRTYCHKLARKCGFRTFRVGPDGYFYLNGKRIFLRCSHSGNNFPGGIQLCRDPELMRRDFDLAKTTGLNAIRFISGYSNTEQLDYCDEIGMMIYQEPVASWLTQDGPDAKELYLENLFTLVKRDRSHPCVVLWGLLNETHHAAPYGMACEAARDCLPELRKLDQTRLVLFSSGRFDGYTGIGSFANPFEDKWNCLWNEEKEGSSERINWQPGDPGAYFHKMGDIHCYPTVPHSQRDIDLIRNTAADGNPALISEYGVGSMFDVVWLCRRFEQRGVAYSSPDFVRVREMERSFTDSFKKYGFDGVFAFPSDILYESALLHSRQRAFIFDIIRSNPKLNGYSITGLLDHAICGEGLWTLWRELKPGIADVMQEGLAPLKWCLFVNPTHVYARRAFTIEGVLADEDVLTSREYKVSARIKGKNGVVWQKEYSFVNSAPHPGLSLPVFKEEISLDVPTGDYELRVEFIEGAAAADGRMTFHLTDIDAIKPIPADIACIGVSDEVRAFLESKQIFTHPLEEYTAREPHCVLIGELPEDKKAEIWAELYKLCEKGCRLLALSAAAFSPDDLHGKRRNVNNWLYHKDYAAKVHPYFDGMPCGKLMDWEYYIHLINCWAFEGIPDETVAACFATGVNSSANGCEAGFNIGRYFIGEGAMVVNCFDIYPNIGKNPAADRLLLNIISEEIK